MNSTRSPPGTGRGPLSAHAIRPASPQQQHQTEAADQGSSRMRKFQQVKPSNMQGERRIITTWGLSQDRKVGLTFEIIVIHDFNRLKQKPHDHADGGEKAFGRLEWTRAAPARQKASAEPITSVIPLAANRTLLP